MENKITLDELYSELERAKGDNTSNRKIIFTQEQIDFLIEARKPPALSYRKIQLLWEKRWGHIARSTIAEHYNELTKK